MKTASVSDKLLKMYKIVEKGKNPDVELLWDIAYDLKKYYVEYIAWYDKTRNHLKDRIQMKIYNDYKKRILELNSAIQNNKFSDLMVAVDTAVNQWHYDYPVLMHLKMEEGQKSDGSDEDEEKINIIYEKIFGILDKLGRLPRKSPYAMACKVAVSVYWHGSKNPDIKQFNVNDGNFALLGTGVYLYKKKESAKKYGEYLYKVQLNGLKIAPKNYEFNANMIEGVMTNLGLTPTSNLPYGARNPVWWCTDGWNYFGLDRKTVVDMVSSFVRVDKDYDGMIVDYPNGGEVCVVWRKYESLNPQLDGSDKIARFHKIAKSIVFKSTT